MKYEAIAPFYDRLMSHVEYDDWCAFINKIIKRYAGTSRPKIFELGGGTGVLGKELLYKGFDYTGSDLSFRMARQAKEKGCSFFCADCRALPIKKRFDLIIFLYDSINYLMTPDDYRKLFDEIHLILNDKALFLFDITTETNSLRHFTDYIDFNDFADYSYVRHSYFDSENLTQINDFTVFKRLKEKAQIFERFLEHHIQKLYSVQEIQCFIPSKKFQIIGIWDGFSFKRYSSRSERIHFLLQRVN